MRISLERTLNDDDLDELEEILTRAGMDDSTAAALAVLMLLREKHGTGAVGLS